MRDCNSKEMSSDILTALEDMVADVSVLEELISVIGLCAEVLPEHPAMLSQDSVH